jgi:hypothetical protein
MDNHYHILIETPLSNLSQILHHINGAYTTYVNVKRGRCGHLFHGRYKAILVEKDAYCQELSGYIHLNPVRAGIVEKPAKYSWSSYPHYIGSKKKVDWLTIDTIPILGYFGKDAASSQNQYGKFLETALKEEDGPLKDVFASTFLGSPYFISKIKEKWFGFKNADARNIPVLKKFKDRPSLKEIKETVKSVIGKDHP